LTQYDDLQTREDDGIPVSDWKYNLTEEDKHPEKGDPKTTDKCDCDKTNSLRKKTPLGYVRTKQFPFSVTRDFRDKVKNGKDEKPKGTHTVANNVTIRGDGDLLLKLAYFSAREIEPIPELFKNWKGPVKQDVVPGPGKQHDVPVGPVNWKDLAEDVLGVLTSEVGVPKIEIKDAFTLDSAQNGLQQLEGSLFIKIATLDIRRDGGHIVIRDPDSLSIARTFLERIAKELGVRELSPAKSLENLPSEAE